METQTSQRQGTSSDEQDSNSKSASKAAEGYLVACIPCLNEEEHIASVIVRARKHVDQVIVCDDGSTDLTADIAQSLGAMVIRHGSNIGKGAAIADMLEVAKGMGATVVVTLDGDGQHNADEIPLLVEPIIQGRVDLVNGSRELGDGMPGHRKLGNRVLNGMTNMVSKGSIRDTQSGFRAFSRRALEEVEVKDAGIGVESQMIIEAQSKGLRVVEVPVQQIYSGGASTYSSARHGTYVVGTVVRSLVERSPLKYLGIPGVILVLAGIVPALDLLSIYNATRYWSLPLTIVTGGFFFIGITLVMTSLLLYSINNLEVRLRHSH